VQRMKRRYLIIESEQGTIIYERAQYIKNETDEKSKAIVYVIQRNVKPSTYIKYV